MRLAITSPSTKALPLDMTLRQFAIKMPWKCAFLLSVTASPVPRTLKRTSSHCTPPDRLIWLFPDKENWFLTLMMKVVVAVP
jgi:hypothetical protein